MQYQVPSQSCEDLATQGKLWSLGLRQDPQVKSPPVHAEYHDLYPWQKTLASQVLPLRFGLRVKVQCICERTKGYGPSCDNAGALPTQSLLELGEIVMRQAKVLHFARNPPQISDMVYRSMAPWPHQVSERSNGSCNLPQFLHPQTIRDITTAYVTSDLLTDKTPFVNRMAPHISPSPCPGPLVPSARTLPWSRGPLGRNFSPPGPLQCCPPGSKS